jgi:tol-pal system protein YbgF
MRRIPALVLAAMLMAAWGASPGAAADREHQQMMADIRMLQEQNAQLQMMLASLNESLKTITGKLDSQVDINRKAFADARLLVDNVASDVRVLREKVNDTNVRISTLSQEMEALRLAIPTTPAVQTPAPAVDPVTGAPIDPGAAAPPGAAQPPAAGLGMTPQRAYESAWADYAAGQWSLAILGFESYIKSFPKSEQADNAQLYIGQAHYFDGKYQEALNAFEQVIALYPRGDAVPEAYYRKGIALDRLGQAAAAREAFETVVKSFPESDAARLARQRLDLMAKPVRNEGAQDGDAAESAGGR